MFPQSLLLSAPYLPSFPEAAFPDSLAHIPPKRKLLQGSAKAIGARCNIENGSLRQAAQACVQRLQAVSALPASTPSGNKRPLPDSPNGPSPSNLLPLSRRIRKDIQIGESDDESPEKEVLRSPPFLENSRFPLSPCVKDIPSPAPLVFTPGSVDDVQPSSPICLPLCHYCCHRGSGKDPVHYFVQCVCDDWPCTCWCYCTEAQLEHKKLVFPGGFGCPGYAVKTVKPEDRPQAKALAEARISEVNNGHCNNPSCMRNFEKDNARALEHK